ncbi:MAG TPA: M48 family metalloprotease [Pyrinomonadaceae bacterium]|nr:M48 family metalloprotease [Pyrinomonadaceae bacterium]
MLVTCLSLAVFLSLNAVGSYAATALWLAMRERASRWQASTRARVLFWLRVLPPATALVFVAALMVPAYLKHEPYKANEAVGLPLLALALFSAFGITFALYRAVASWLMTRRLTTLWLRQAESVSVKGITIPSYRLSYSTPVLAVVGTLRPRLFIAGQVMNSLSPEEMEVALAHERGHLVARDTLKRAVMHVCRDLLPFIGAGRVLERAWAEEAERAADEYAARSGAACALDLAAALIKIARLTPKGVKNIAPAGAFLLEGASDGLVSRVRLLTEMASTRWTPVGNESQLSKVALMTGFIAFAAVIAMASDWHISANIHTITEHIVKLLS